METLQADAEPVEKEMINGANILLSSATTGKAQKFIQDTDAPLHDESVIAVRDKSMDVGDEKVSDEDACLSRSMTITAYDQIAAGLLDYQHVTLHVRLTPKTKDSINEESLLRFSLREQTSVTSPMRHWSMPKSATLIDAARPDRVLGGRDA